LKLPFLLPADTCSPAKYIGRGEGNFRCFLKKQVPGFRGSRFSGWFQEIKFLKRKGIIEAAP
jgi:hypothetical protein